MKCCELTPTKPTISTLNVYCFHSIGAFVLQCIELIWVFRSLASIYHMYDLNSGFRTRPRCTQMFVNIHIYSKLLNSNSFREILWTFALFWIDWHHRFVHRTWINRSWTNFHLAVTGVGFIYLWKSFEIYANIFFRGYFGRFFFSLSPCDIVPVDWWTAISFVSLIDIDLGFSPEQFVIGAFSVFQPFVPHPQPAKAQWALIFEFIVMPIYL